MPPTARQACRRGSRGCAGGDRAALAAAAGADLRLVDGELSPVVDVRQRVPAARLRVRVSWPCRASPTLVASPGGRWRRPDASCPAGCPGGPGLLAGAQCRARGSSTDRSSTARTGRSVAHDSRAASERRGRPRSAAAGTRSRGAGGSAGVRRERRGSSGISSKVSESSARRKCSAARQLSRSARPQPQGQSRS